MSAAPTSAPELARFLPASLVGVVSSVVPLHAGLSGARVYAVGAERGEYILRVQGDRADRSFRQHVLVQRRAAALGVAPAVVHVDEDAGAVVSVRITGVALPAVLADPVQRPLALAGIVEQLRRLHAMERDGIEPLDAVAFARGVFEGQRGRTGFPRWAHAAEPSLDAIAARLARDPRRVVSHNDLNPGNVLWDGASAWLVDWEVAALGHPYYDLAALSTFLNLPDDAAHALLERQEQAPLDAAARATFGDLRALAALAIGCMFLSLVVDDGLIDVPSRADAPTRAEVHAELRTGRLAIHAPRGQAAYGLSMLRAALEDVEGLSGAT